MVASERAQPWVLGVDGGGTRARAALVDGQGGVLGEAVGGGGNLHTATRAQLQSNLERLWRRACAAGGVNPARVQGAYLGLASVLTEEDRLFVRGLVAELGFVEAERVSVHHDIRVALAGGLAGAPGIALIAGTGSSCFGLDEDGRSAQAGGWGHLIDDAGSAYRIALAGLTAAARAADGRGPETALSERLFEALGVTGLAQLPGRLHAGSEAAPGAEMNKAEVAALAPHVTEAATRGDRVAGRIVDGAVAELVLMVRAVAGRLCFTGEPLRLVAVGSVVNNDRVARPLCDRLRHGLPGVVLTAPTLSPERGAALLALRNEGVAITDTVIQAMRDPGPDRRETGS